MANRKNGVRQLDKEELPVSVELSDIEKANATATAAKAEDAGKDENAGGKMRAALAPEAWKLFYNNHLGVQTSGLYGPRESRPLDLNDMKLRSAFLKRSLTVTDYEEMHGADPSAPPSAECGFCQKEITGFVRTALVKPDGDLMRDRDGNVIYRGQAVVVGSPMSVQPGHTGNCLFQLRDARKRTKQLPNGRTVRDLLPAQAFDQANARLAGVTASFTARREQNEGFRQRIGFSGKEGYRNGPHKASGGRPGRGRELPDSSGISNRGPRR